MAVLCEPSPGDGPALSQNGRFFHESDKISACPPGNFITSEKSGAGGLTAAAHGVILSPSSKQKPMRQRSSRNAFFPASRRQWKGGRNNSGEWTAEGGLNRAQAPSMYRRAFPPLPGKGMCLHTAERAIVSPIWVAPQKFRDFCPKGTCHRSFSLG